MQGKFGCMGLLAEGSGAARLLDALMGCDGCGARTALAACWAGASPHGDGVSVRIGDGRST